MATTFETGGPARESGRRPHKTPGRPEGGGPRDGGLSRGLGADAHEIIDLRSDTVTKPTEAMREAMARAQVGDDVFGDDPTVRGLEELAAHLLGKEAALFLPSGTMANLVALLTHSEPGREVLLGETSHIYYYEVGGLSRIAGLFPRLFRGGDGHPAPEELRALLRPANIHFPEPALLCLENTHNLAGGVVLAPGRVRELAAVAREAGLAVHLDGARLFNAAAALDVDVRELTADVDSVMVSLSKGLSAPVGSVLAGTRSFIGRARKMRKLLGGGMRQVGVIAAAGVVALETMTRRLKEDHNVARAIARELAAVDGVDIDLSKVQTNIIVFAVPESAARGEETTPAAAFLQRLERHGVLGVPRDARRIRFVTHRHIGMEDVPRIAAAVRASL